ncbi:MAG TPA: hypothetical protein DCY50_02910 [Franconibacter helveticus]|nr:hypothetical protein [Franconibacter helveticus]
MRPDSRGLGTSYGLPVRPETQYLLCRNANGQNDLAQIIFQSMENSYTPWNYVATAGSGDDSIMTEDDIE